MREHWFVNSCNVYLGILAFNVVPIQCSVSTMLTDCVKLLLMQNVLFYVHIALTLHRKCIALDARVMFALESAILNKMRGAYFPITLTVVHASCAYRVIFICGLFHQVR